MINGGIIMTGVEDIGAAFGGEYLEKYKKLSMSRMTVSEFKEDQRKLALHTIVDKLVDGKTRGQYTVDDKLYDIVLAKAWRDMRVREGDNATSIQFVDNDFWFGGWVPNEQVSKILAEEFYVLVGTLYKSKAKTGDRKFDNMSVGAVFTMDEIVQYKKDMDEQKAETNSAMEGHQESFLLFTGDETKDE